MLRFTKKSSFLAIFLLTMFGTMLKYLYVYQQANINRQQLAPFPVGGERYSGEPHVFVSADTRQKAFYVNKARQNKIMNIVTKIRVNLCHRYSWSNSLCALMPLWLCPFSSTNVEDSLQINLFMQNKPNLVRRRRIPK